MATAAEWLEGARPRTLPTAIAPVLAGTAIAIADGGARWELAVLCLVVTLGLVIGVNFANDYSDGIRGSDGQDRVGPLRLVGSGVAEPSHVKAAAFGCFGVSAVAGLVITILTGHWWFIIVGLVCILAAWFYTGGSHPYGYAGLGEIFVFVFFGLVAVGGTTYVQT
ncbi:MAG: 1,4-dihydroxy-2-naphthoate polyprenyltransferase, partial [Cutibacterium avidum]|nr:1,4-dihydroxy-2-naphthoate polyprenyltransferase [Cutibacterium avidum]